ncbi:MAG: serine hydrolase domain-containing protein [Granulosicoccus sp.]
MNKVTHWQPLLDFAQRHACPWSFDPDSSGNEWGIHQLDDPPHNRLLGPVFSRGGPAGIILKEGEVLCQWGDIDRPDMTFSVTKTYLALTAGVAFDQGLLTDLDEPVYRRLPDIGFETEHNQTITWRHFLHFTSEWEGKCFGVPDQIDRYRLLGFQPDTHTQRKGDPRPLKTPGTYWEYNDIRINQFSYALLHLFKRPLPDVFGETVMLPLAASNTWQWHGYENSWCNIEGIDMQSVPGGGHWGGGMVISARDQTRVAQLLMNQGMHAGQQVISTEWISLMLTPCPIAPFYGFFTWLNTDHVISKSASPKSYFALGIGGQLIWHDPDQNLSAVLRWINSERTEDYIQLINGLLRN